MRNIRQKKRWVVLILSVGQMSGVAVTFVVLRLSCDSEGVGASLTSTYGALVYLPASPRRTEHHLVSSSIHGIKLITRQEGSLEFRWPELARIGQTPAFAPRGIPRKCSGTEQPVRTVHVGPEANATTMLSPTLHCGARRDP